MKSQFVSKNESLLDKEDGAFLFCLELGKGLIKRNFNQLGIFDYSFVNVLNSIEQLSFTQLKQLGLDSVIFTDGVINESKVIDYIVGAELEKMPIGTHPFSVDSYLTHRKTYSKYFNISNKALEVKTILANTNFISDEIITIDENVAIGTVLSNNIVLVSLNTVNYELLNYTDTFVFENGFLKTIGIIDYETRTNYILQLKITDKVDSSKFWLETVTVNINNLSDTITFKGSRVFTVIENNPINTVIVDMKTLYNSESGMNIFYDMVNNSSYFAFDGDNFIAKVSLDYESISQFVTTVRLRDAITNNFWDTDITVNVTNVADSVTLLNNRILTINENNSVNAVIGDLSTFFIKESGLNVSLTLTDNVSNFSISGSNLLAKAVFNYENLQSYIINVKITNTTNTTQFWNMPITVNIGNIADTLTLKPVRTFSISENNAVNAIIGNLENLIIKESGLNVSYTLLDNVSNFSISGSNLLAKIAFDYETTTTYSINIKITNTANTTQYWTMGVIVNIADVADGPIAPVVGFTPGPGATMTSATWSIFGGNLVGSDNLQTNPVFWENRQSTLKTPDGVAWVYWQMPYADDSSYVIITVTTAFRIWSFANTPYYQFATLKFINNTTGTIVSNTVTVLTNPPSNNQWTLASSVIPAGTYKITTYGDSTYGANSAYRIDHGWFLEKK